MDAYKTLLQVGEVTLIEKKSRFIAQARPVADEDEAQVFLAKIRKQYWDASHHVFAYIIGDRKRASDDGEPQGSSGPPVLEALNSAGLRDAMIVVTRYFGGTLLGVGGLVRAYGAAARAGIEQAGIIEKKLCREYFAEIEYAAWEFVRRALGEYVRDVTYAERVRVEFLVEITAVAEFEVKFADATGGAFISAGAQRYSYTGGN